jgi:uncharacterized protein YicC (UPF0701 family)
MTGFGRGTVTADKVNWSVELRSVNHRYLDISIKSPRSFMAWDDRIRKDISSVHSRGRVDVFVTFNDTGIEGTRLRSDVVLAKESAYRDIIAPVDEENDTDELEEFWPDLKSALHDALNECLDMRRREGEVLLDDLTARLSAFEKMIDEIEGSLPLIIEKRKQLLEERLGNLLSSVDIDPLRLAQEVAILVDKSDVSEELVRLRSHMEQFRGFLNLDEPVGRRLDFLVQEFLREVNTISSKINHAETAHLIVSMKNDLEKIREQVQNLE